MTNFPFIYSIYMQVLNYVNNLKLKIQTSVITLYNCKSLLELIGFVFFRCPSKSVRIFSL